MFNKIDKKILDNISTLGISADKINVIIHSNKYMQTKKYIEDKFSEYYELPFVSCLALKVGIKELYKFAEMDDVNYISATTNVSGLIYKSKKFMGVETLENRGVVGEHSVVIIDTGIYPHIDFLLGKNRVIEFVDLVNNREVMYDDNGHGTFVAGILSANSITSKYSGIDKNSNIIAIKALDNGGETDSITILQAMQWVIDNKVKYNIKVVCMSFGAVLGRENDPLIRGVEVLWDNGICVVCAGGNNGPEKATIMSPGASRKIITVGSLDITKTKIEVANFSSRGPAFNYYKPDIITPGVDIISTAVFDASKKFYTTMSGTSVSAPMVAGVVSLMYNINPSYTPDQIKYLIANAGVRINDDRNSEGFGWLDVRKILI